MDDSLEALGLDPEDLRAGVLEKKSAKAQGTNVSAAGSRTDGSEGSAAEGCNGQGIEGSAERYGMLPFCHASHAGGQCVIELRADAGYDTRQIFEILQESGNRAAHQDKEERQQQGRRGGQDARPGRPGTDVRRRSPVRNNLPHWTGASALQNQQDWKRRVGYGRRWLVEIVFSSLKRMFGSSVNAVKMENIVQEIAIRINTYNKLLAVAREAIAKA